MKLKKLLPIILLLCCLIAGAQCPPQLSVLVLTHTLTCNTPTLLATASSTDGNTTFSWSSPFPGNGTSQPTIIIDPSQYAIIGPQPPNYTYTITVTNTVGACSTTSLLTIYYNYKPPVCSASIISTPSYICNGNTVILSQGNNTVTSGVQGASVITVGWNGPTGQPLGSGITCSAVAGGVYSLTIKDSFNGCAKIGTVNVMDQRPDLSLKGWAPTTSLSCNGTATVVTPSSGYSVSSNMGLVNDTIVNNLCYGKLLVCLTYTASGCKRCDSLMINAATSINELDDLNDLVIYPNPSKGKFIIKGLENKNVSVKLFNAEGKEIEGFVLERKASTGSATSEIKNLDAGIYLVELNVEGTMVRKKIVVLGY